MRFINSDEYAGVNSGPIPEILRVHLYMVLCSVLTVPPMVWEVGRPPVRYSGSIDTVYPLYTLYVPYTVYTLSTLQKPLPAPQGGNLYTLYTMHTIDAILYIYIH